MSAAVSGRDLRNLLLGIRVDRATAVLPATATGQLFTVAGGRVMVMGLVGEFTVAASATATTVLVVSTPTVGTAVTWASATAITSKEIGSQMTLPAASAGALVVKDAGNGGQVQVAAPYIAGVGSIGITTSATNTGSAKWSLWYIPLDDGATVVAV